MVRFKCKQSGNIFEFQNEHDIKTMRSHPEYEELPDLKVYKSEDKPVKRVYNKAVKE